MNTKQINVVLLEDEAAHAEAIWRALESAGGLFKVQITGSVKKYRELVAKNQPDIALLDMVLPDGNALDLLIMPREQNAYPMLVLTSHGNEQAAVAALKKGALDYIVKSPETFANMPRIVTGALNQWALIQERKKAGQALQISEANFRNSIENSPLGSGLSMKMVILSIQTGCFWTFTAIKISKSLILHRLMNVILRTATLNSRREKKKGSAVNRCRITMM